MACALALGMLAFIFFVVVPLVFQLAISIFVCKSISIPLFRLCRVREDRVLVSAPILFGGGYVFDRAQQAVTIRRQLVGIRISAVQIPFSDIAIRMESESRGTSQWYSYGGASIPRGSRTTETHKIMMSAPQGKEFMIAQFADHTEPARRILAAI